MPYQVGLRIAMQQQQREPISLFSKMDGCPTGIDLSVLKVIEQADTPTLTEKGNIMSHMGIRRKPGRNIPLLYVAAFVFVNASLPWAEAIR
jgi:hypothetical protein